VWVSSGNGAMPQNHYQVTPDGQFAISGSKDNTLKVLHLESGDCTGTLEGHTGSVNGVALTPDGRLAVAGTHDGTVRVWDLSFLTGGPGEDVGIPRYTNAKVVLVGKTGLALRLCEDRWEATESTHGMAVYPLKLPPGDGPAGMEREVWLWDFAGQPDYRLIHQLYMDETALGLLVFDPQDDNPFDSLGYWEKALHAATKYEPARLLVAGRCDRGGITISEKRFDQFVREHNFAGFLRTGARTGEGCEELKAAIAKHIPWDRLPWTATTRLFRTLKEAILKLTEEDAPLVRLPEMLQRLQLMLPGETIGQEELRAVVGLMQGQGVLKKLDFGDFVLLQPEQINRYASVVVRMAREHVDEMGTVPEQQVLDGRLDYKGMKRLSESDEKILLRAMAQTFLDRSLCLREETPRGTMLVFPSYFRRDKPDLPEHPNVFVTYGFAGQFEEIYATLVVRLNYSDGFQRDQLWKNAADFKTQGGKRVGLAMNPKGEGEAEIVVYFEADVPDDTKVTFIKYVHEHLLARAQDVTRVRTYVCPHCDEPLEARRAIRVRLEKGFRDIGCPICEGRVPLIDLIEEKFASDEFLQLVRELDERARINLDNESRELILVGHAFAIAGEAGQIFRPTPNSDWGIDGEIEFKDREGNASGKRVYLQLKSGDSYLRTRKRDDKEIFTIKNPRHAAYWQEQPCPVMLVIRTSDGEIRWMNVTEYLKKHGKETKQIEFDGEPFMAPNVMKLRDRLVEN
jgi:GTPase SAR1 family protein